MMGAPPKTDSLLVRFERLDDQVPVTDEEARAVLAEAGLNPAESAARLRPKLCRVHEEELRRLIQAIHQAYHQDEPGTWEDCTRPSCSDMRRFLADHS